MNFTYEAYKELMDNLKSSGYAFSSYSDWKDTDKSVIIRHDVDYSIERTSRIAEIEHEKGIRSIYFLLLTSDFYNVFSKKSIEGIRYLRSLGHDIGLHFDETRYPEYYGNQGRIRDAIIRESCILGQAVGDDIKVVSMHRPSRAILDSNLEIPGIINSYGRVFFEQFKYLSDSRRNWRESVENIIKGCEYDRLHILIHTFWYGEDESDIHDSILGFVNSANRDRYVALRDNISDIDDIMCENEIV